MQQSATTEATPAGQLDEAQVVTRDNRREHRFAVHQGPLADKLKAVGITEITRRELEIANLFLGHTDVGRLVFQRTLLPIGDGPEETAPITPAQIAANMATRFPNQPERVLPCVEALLSREYEVPEVYIFDGYKTVREPAENPGVFYQDLAEELAKTFQPLSREALHALARLEYRNPVSRFVALCIRGMNFQLDHDETLLVKDKARDYLLSDDKQEAGLALLRAMPSHPETWKMVFDLLNEPMASPEVRNACSAWLASHSGGTL